MGVKTGIIGLSCKEITLTKGAVTVVDGEDFEYLNQWKWHLSAKGYACRKPGKRAIFMHRIINKTPNGLQTDHINQNKLDNRKCNLRTVTNQTNHFNMPPQKNNSAGRIGVGWDRFRKKWRAQIMVNDRNIFLGRFDDLQQAIIARQQAEQEYHVI